LATFSEDARIHFGFNGSVSEEFQGVASDLEYQERLLKYLEFPRDYNNPGSQRSVWVPADKKGGLDANSGGMFFRGTNYGRVTKIIDDVYNNRTYGARKGATPLVILISDGSMDGTNDEIYKLNPCTEAVTGPGTCGTGTIGADLEACKSCYRKSLERKVQELMVHGRAVEDKDIITIGVGDPNATSDKPDPRTLEIFSRNVQENTIRQIRYKDLQSKVLPVIERAINKQKSLCCRQCPPVDQCNPTCGQACGVPEARVHAIGFPKMNETCGAAFAPNEKNGELRGCSCDEGCYLNKKSGGVDCCPDFYNGGCDANFLPCCADTSTTTSSSSTSTSHSTTTPTTTSTATSTSTSTETSSTSSTSTTSSSSSCIPDEKVRPAKFLAIIGSQWSRDGTMGRASCSRAC